MSTDNKLNCDNYSSGGYSLEACKRDFIEDLREVGKRRDGMDNLIKYLQKKTCFLDVPAYESGQENREGGHIRHSLNVMSRMIRDFSADKVELGQTPEVQKDLLDSIMIISHLYGIWKADYYQRVTEKKVGSDGKEIEVTYYRPKPPEERLCFGRDNDHGDQAVYMIQSYINITRDEALAIRSQDWDPHSVEGSRVLFKTPLAVYFHSAMVKARYMDDILVMT